MIEISIITPCTSFIKYMSSSYETCTLPACRRLLFPLLHAEKGPFSSCNKGNRRRLHAGNMHTDLLSFSFVMVDMEEIFLRVLDSI